MRCVSCRERISKSVLKSRNICQACYLYERKGGTLYDPSPAGLLVFDTDDNPICHICGQAHQKLGGHIYWRHKMTVKEYKEKFNLNQVDRLTGLEYRSKMRDHVLRQPEIIEQNLRKAGQKTRYKPQDARCVGRKNKKKTTVLVSLASADTLCFVREQEKLID